jgi:uncharacterized protein (TIGR02677 family)
MTTGPATAPRHLLDQVAAFKYVTVENAPSYRAIVQVFYEARQHYVIELRPSEVLARLAESTWHAEIADEATLVRHLDQLFGWGNLSRRHDSAAVTRIEDFYRRSFVYNLSAAGEAAHRAVLEVEQTVGRSGSLQASMLERIRDVLRALAAGGEPAKLFGLLHDLDRAFETLTEEASRFIGELDRAQSATHDDETSFAAYKQAVLAYVGRFVERLRALSAEIADAIGAVRDAGLDAILEAAASSGDLPPTAGGVDPAEAWIAGERARFEGVAGWFIGDGTHTPTVDRLARAAVSAVVDLTRTLGRLNEQRLRPADRAADMRVLARWFEACETDDAAHAMWHGAFGLHSARHFHLAEEDPEAASPQVSWWDAPPVRVPVRLRTRGQVSRSGRPPAAPDHGHTREWLAQRQRRDRQRQEVALRRFLDRGPVRLSALGAVDEDELDLLLMLLDASLGQPAGEGGIRRGTTPDGRLAIVLGGPDDGAPPALLRATGGVLACADYVLEVRRRGRRADTDAKADPDAGAQADYPADAAPRAVAPADAEVGS